MAFPPDYAHSSILTPTFQYSPSFALLVQPLHALSWSGFHLLVVGLGVVSLAYLVGPWVALLLIAVQAPLVYRELLEGNLNLAAAALLVLGMQRAWVWPALLLTKVTPGVGLVWFAVRREWRTLGMALTLTLAIAAVTFALAPDAWAAWSGVLLGDSGQVTLGLPTPLRIALGAGVVAYAAAQNQRWWVPLGVAVAYPVPFLGWVVLLAMWRLGLRDALTAR